MMEPIEETKPEDVDRKSKEEDPKLAIDIIHALASYVNPQMMKLEGFLKHQLVTILINIGSTNNFVDSNVAARLTLQIKDYSRFDVKVANGRILNCNRKCSRVRLVLQGQEIVTDCFLLPLENYEAVLGIEWLSTLYDVS
ncbi:hypothetical protein BHM03_00057209 [Ensete ventricosum]|nr:hypothetical protein BHM03_00057209 [Ensete ventricosum]